MTFKGLNKNSLSRKAPFINSVILSQAASVGDLEKAFSTVTKLLETAGCMTDPRKARVCLAQGLEELREKLAIPASNGKKSDGEELDGYRDYRNL